MDSQDISISRKTLVDLYQKQKLSTDAIAKIFKVRSHVTILNYLKKYNIPRRSRLGNRLSINITKEVLADLYYGNKLTQKQIAQKFGNQSATAIQGLMKKYDLKPRGYSEANTKYPKFNFDGSQLEQAYLIGFRLGDLNVTRIHNLIQVRCSTTIDEQIRLFETLFTNYGHINFTKARRGTYEICILLNESFNFLLPKHDCVDSWILNNSKYFLAFLAGYTDAEGSYFIRQPYYKTKKPPWGVFEIQSYDGNIIQTIFNKVRALGIDAALSIDTRKKLYKHDMYRITIVKKQSLWNFIKLIKPYHRHQAKIQDLIRVENNLIARNLLPQCRKISL